ncbi:MAG: hypothetical protein MK085_02265, partial [Phycisphaerales bacterium]|nr:hypothetical protein [Phycisphaerales bacterium]
RKSVMKLIRETKGSFRDGIDEFYILQRTRQWATVVSHAARYWYRSCVPLVDQRAAEWAWRCRPRDKTFRINQMRLCEDLGVHISGLPFEGGFRCPNGPFSRLGTDLKALGALSRSVRNRLFGKRRKPDLNADEATHTLLASGNMEPGIVEMLSEVGVQDPDQVMEWVNGNTGALDREIGFLVTLSLLREQIAGIAATLDSTT